MQNELIKQLNVLSEKAVEGHLFATDKDIERADNLNIRGRSYEHIAGPITKSNILKMANSITDKNKILGRFEAVFAKYGAKLSKPLAIKLVDLNPNTNWSKAYAEGVSDQTYMGTVGYSGNRVEKMLYACGRVN